jgi:hypothetical protein
MNGAVSWSGASSLAWHVRLIGSKRVRVDGDHYELMFLLLTVRYRVPLSNRKVEIKDGSLGVS